MTKKLLALISVVIIATLLLAACGTPATQAPAATEAPAAATEAPVATAAATEAAAPVTITWWHITTKDPGLTEFQKMADDYMAAHPNVIIEITVLENEAFKTKLTEMLL